MCGIPEDSKQIRHRRSEIECGQPIKGIGYISGGEEVKRGQFPWSVQNMIRSNRFTSYSYF